MSHSLRDSLPDDAGNKLIDADADEPRASANIAAFAGACNGPTKDREPYTPFPIVGIGASAGSLEPLKQLFGELPERTGMAFVVVLHLDPEHESRLGEILGKSTRMPVVGASDGMRIEPDHVYVIPPKCDIAVAEGAFRVTARAEMRGRHLPVDHLFRSLAESQQARAIGVILSGTGSDGTLGIAEIKAVGGITFAQDERSATHSGMPRSAVNSGSVDFVLPPEKIARRLADIGSHPYLAEDAAAASRAEAEDPYQDILRVLRGATGVDFSLYRGTTIRRRIMRRMALHADRSLGEYFHRLQADATEVEALYHDILINVTSFFRDPEMFETLKTVVFPEIVKEKGGNAPIRIWVPGCSTGQEAYSLAMVLVEFLDDQAIHPPIQIFATDLSEPAALERARAGVYPKNIEAEITPARLRRFFKKEDHVYRIEKYIRDMCVFARQNLTADPPFSHVDLISCRNVLIYMAPALQKRVLPIFHYALNTPGYIVLGSSETIGEFSEMFESVDRRHKIYAKKPAAGHPQFFPVNESYKQLTGTALKQPGSRGWTPAEYQREADRVLVGRYAPPGVLVNENFEIIQFRGRTSAYLEPPPGEPTTNLLRMARDGLLFQLRAAFDQAKKRKQPVRRERVRVRGEIDVREVNLEVVPVPQPGSREACYLVLFEQADAQPGRSATLNPPSGESSERRDLETDDIAKVSNELAAAQGYLHSLLEQQDAANEELRSANEEILSSNQELQSTNEELQTAKEELQSTNEELLMVNEQLRFRNLELNQVTDYLSNLLTSTAIPVVTVARDLTIRQFTPTATAVMNLVPTDIGRPITDLEPNIDIGDLEKLTSEVIDRVEVRTLEIRDRSGRWHMLRIHPYRTSDNKIDGAVILLLDIDQMKQAEKALHQQAELLDLTHEAIFIRESDGQIIYWNRGATELYGYIRDEAVGRSAQDLLKTEIHGEDVIAERLDAQGHWVGELTHIDRNGRRVVVESRQQIVTQPDGRRVVLETNRDITERKRLDQQLKQSLEDLRQADRKKNQFLAMLAHELRNPLAPIRSAVGVLRTKDVPEPDVAWCRDVIDRQVKHMAILLDDLLDLGRVVSDKLELRKTTVRLAEIMQSAIETSQPHIDTSKQVFVVDVPDEPVTLEGDFARLSQVFANLLNNAAKYTPPGGEIRLTAAVEDDEVVVTVTDTGMGISPELLPNIFDMFVQGELFSPNERGLGIGLTLVQKVVELHGGTVQAHSRGIGQGSEFIVRLPIARNPEDVETARPECRQLGKSEAKRPWRILLVDDSEVQTRSLGMYLELMGYHVRLASDGTSALETLGEFAPDAALIDIGLPGMSGYDLARRIREQPKFRDMLLVAQTGWGRDEDRRSARAAGFDHHMVKPVEPEAVVNLLSGCLGGA